MATLNLVLDKRRVKKDSTYPVVFRLTANRKQAFIPTGISINEQDYIAIYIIMMYFFKNKINKINKIIVTLILKNK
jgi:hypothetical protein